MSVEKLINYENSILKIELYWRFFHFLHKIMFFQKKILKISTFLKNNIIRVKVAKVLEQLLSTWLVAPSVEIEGGH